MKIARRLASKAAGFFGRPARRAGFLRDNAGTTAIEFAMISVPFIGLIGAIFETGTVYFRSAQLQMTTENASRKVLTHDTEAGLTYQKFIEENICTWKKTGTVKTGTLSKMFDCDKVIVDISSPLDWSSGSTDANIYGTPHPGTSVIAMPPPGQIAIVRVVYPMPVLAGFLGGGVIKGQTHQQIRKGQVLYNSAWTHMLLGIAAFRVEP